MRSKLSCAVIGIVDDDESVDIISTTVSEPVVEPITNSTDDSVCSNSA